MIYGRSRLLHDLGLVVLDEVHFLQDTYRGPVWEEVIIHLPPARPARLPVGDGEQRRGARRLDHAPCADRRRRSSRTPPGAAREPLPRRRQDERPPAPAAGARRRQRRTPTRSGSTSAAARGGRGARKTARSTTRPADGRMFTPRRGSRSSSCSSGEQMLPGDLLHLQPQRSATRPPRPCIAAGLRLTTGEERDRDPRDRRRPRSPASTPPTSRCSATPSSSRSSRPASPPTTPAWCRRSRRSSRPASSRGWSRWCSPPRRWPSASTCRRAPS